MFFKEFPVVPYNFNISGKNTIRMVRDISLNVKLSKEVLDNLSYYSDYEIQDGETPERISEKLYGNSQYHWLIMMCNNKFDYSEDFPVTGDTLYRFVQKKYGEGNEQEQHLFFGRPHFESQRGNLIYGYQVNSVFVENGGANYPSNTEIEFMDSVWKLPFSSGEGLVPKNGIAVNGDAASAELLGVYYNNNGVETRCKIGSNMPAVGWLKIKMSTGNFAQNETINISNSTITTSSTETTAEPNSRIKARASLNIVNGKIQSINLLDSGSGYINPPDYRLSQIPATPAKLNIICPELNIITNYEYEFRLNEQKRKIKVVNPNVVGRVADELRNII